MPKTKPADNYFAEELQQMYLRAQQQPPPLGDKPLITIVAARPSPAPKGLSDEEWRRLVQEKVDQKRAYAFLSSNSKVVMDEKAGHHIHLDDPETVVNAVRDVRDSAQHHTSLAR